MSTKMKFGMSVFTVIFLAMTAMVQAQETVVFSEDFEGTAHSFTIVNGTPANRWSVGTAVAYEGTKSAYISNNSGTSNAYTVSSASTVHMYRDVTFPASYEPFNLSFYWRCQGERSYDYLRVSMVATSTTPAAGNLNNLGTALGTYVMGGAAVWNKADIIIPESNSGLTRRLVFTWVNDASAGAAPPAAIDNIVLTAVIGPPRPLISFNLNNGSGTAPASFRADEGRTVSETRMPPTNNFTRTGFVNDGKWYTRLGIGDNAVYTEFKFGAGGTLVAGDVELYLRWFPFYTVNFNRNGGTVGTVPADIRVVQNGTVSAAQRPSTTPFTRTGFVNDGKWYTRVGIADPYIFTEFIFGETGTPVTGDITLFLQWTPSYTVSFDRNGGTVGTVPGNITVAQNGTVSEAQRPSTVPFTRTGFINDGKWYTRAGITEPYTFTEFIFGDGGTRVTAATILYLQWLPAYTVSFNRNGGAGGTLPANFQVLQNSRLGAEERPSAALITRTGFTHDDKWYTRTGTAEPYVYTEFIFNSSSGTRIQANTTLYLRWTIDAVRYDSQLAGAGTTANPYRITTPRQLAFLSLMVNEGNSAYNTAHYRLENDIDLSAYLDASFNGGKGWVPIGRANAPFRGTFNGNAKKITGLYINDNTLHYAGLFGHVNCNSCNLTDVSVFSIGLENVNITAGDFTGAIAGYVSGGGGLVCQPGNIEPKGGVRNSYSSGMVRGANFVGGIIGRVHSWGYAMECYSTAEVSGGSNVGGIAGYVSGEVQYNLALNSKVAGTTAVRTGRVVGFSVYNDSSRTVGWIEELVSNHAFNGILNNSNNTTWSNKGLNLRDGDDVRIIDIDASPTLNGRFNEARGFSVASGFLPGFGAPVTKPPHLGGGVPVVNALVPTVNTQPSGSTVTTGSVLNLSVAATASDNGTLSYQWYSSTSASGSDGTIISGKTGATFTDVPTSAAGTYYYYVIVTNTIANNGDGGQKTARVASSVATVRVNAPDIDPNFPDGNGTVGNPFQISTAAQLAKLAELVNAGNTLYNNKSYILTADISLSAYGEAWNSGKGWITIGDSLNPFGGTFDGNAKKITGLYINDNTLNFAGLFGYIVSSTVKNLGIENSSVTGRNNVGSVAGYSSGSSVTNCYSTGSVTGNANVGGLAGYLFNNCSMENSYFAGSVTGAQSNIGGVAGMTHGSSVVNCYSAGSVTGSGDNVGGVVGSVFSGGVSGGLTYYGAVRNSYSAADVTGSSYNVGGVAGFLSFGGSLTNNYSAGSVTGNINVGGVIGLLSGGNSVANCYATGGVTGDSHVGGVVGRSFEGSPLPSITESAALNLYVKGSSDVGRVIGNDIGVISGNVAFAAMGTNGGAAFSGNAKIDGEAVTAAAINADGTIGGLFTVQNGWTIENGRLPGLLDAALAMPLHLGGSPAVNAQAPSITAQPLGGTVEVFDEFSMTVAATSPDGGTLTYQWYFTNSIFSDFPIVGATGSSHAVTSISPLAVGTVDYYVIVTNTIANNGDGGTKTAFVKSNTVTVTTVHTGPVNAIAPTIFGHPSSASLPVGARHVMLAGVGIVDGGTLTYQWYRSATASNTGGELIDDATGNIYEVILDATGVYYFYAVITNTITDNGDGGTKTASIVSNFATVSIYAFGDAAPPVIISQPQDAGVKVDYDLVLSAEAQTGDGGTLSYQWWFSPTIGGAGTAIEGATGASFSPSTDELGTFYYYAVITNTNTTVSGTSTAVTTSRRIEVTVGSTACQAPDRTIPPLRLDNETMEIPSAALFAGEFTAGPNPVVRQSGAVNFFWQGRRIQSASLAVFDASGKVVSRIKIKDKSDTKNRRVIGSWDLTDTKGRSVSEGTYLVRGVITDVNGKKERVSAVIGVR